MTSPIAPASAGSSTRPYLIRALHDWCTDNGFTPYIAVFVDEPALAGAMGEVIAVSGSAGSPICA